MGQEGAETAREGFQGLSREKREPYHVLLALLLYGVFGLYQLGFTTFFVDEATRAYQASLSVPALLGELKSDIHPPLYMLVQHGWQRLFGQSDVVLRSLSVLVAGLGLLLVYGTWRLLEVPLRMRLFALLLLATSPSYVEYSRLAFSWPLFSALVSGMVFCLMALRRQASLPALVGLILASSGALFTNYLAGVLGIAAALFWLFGRKRFAAPLRWMAYWAVAVVVLYSVWLPTFFDQWKAQLHDTASLSFHARSARFVPRLAACGFQFVLGDSSNPADWGIVGSAALVALALIALGIRALRAPDETKSPSVLTREYFVLQLVLFAAGLCAMTWLHGEQHYLFTAERLQFALPALMLLAGVGLYRLKWGSLALWLLIGAHVLLHQQWLGEKSYLNWAYHTHWNTYCQRLAKHAQQPEETVVAFDNYAFGRVGERYCGQLGRMVPIMDETHTRPNPQLRPAVDAARNVIWIQSNRDSSPGKQIDTLFEEARRGMRTAARMQFLAEPLRWYELKRHLGEGAAKRFKILAVSMVSEEIPL